MASPTTSTGISRRGLLLGSAAATTGCALRAVPPLEQLYRDVQTDDQPPLIVIPGAFGSRLRRVATGEEIWPRSNASLLFSSYPEIGVEFDPDTLEPIEGDVEASEVFRAGLGQDFYGAVLDTLEHVGRYQRLYPGQKPDKSWRCFYVYVYDWRLDNVTAVQGLHDLIEQVALDHENPALRVDVLAHSNGGLLARYYARYGTADVLTGDTTPPAHNGSHRIHRLLMVGTPNLGSMQPVLSHVRGEEIGLRNIPADIVATCPGAPQLMPHPDMTCFVNMRGDPIDLDVYDIDTWRTLKWSLFSPRVRARVVRRLNSRRKANSYLGALEAYLARHLQRGRRFHEVMSVRSRPDEPVPYIFGGDCTPTVARLVVENRGSLFRGHERADRIEHPHPGVNYEALISEPGDGVVIRDSLLGRHANIQQSEETRLEIAQLVFLCEAHQQLTSNPSFQDNLLYALLSRD